ncbi:MAG TPA: chemotaxis protein CheX [Opitutus sp.]|jgi:chemotaxis protein CheX|nr:chemotaxis protein CheX [Opitutus sp.]
MTAVKSPVTDQVIQECIIRSVQTVFHTMAGDNVTFVEQATEESGSLPLAASHIIASVGFLGAADGLIYLCLPEEFAKIASGRILGMSRQEVEMHGEEVVHDAIGEITNMTVGGFKNTLCDMGFPCKLTLPAIVRGNKLSIAAIKSATRHIFHFECSGHRLTVDIQLKID